MQCLDIAKHTIFWYKFVPALSTVCDTTCLTQNWNFYLKNHSQSMIIESKTLQTLNSKGLAGNFKVLNCTVKLTVTPLPFHSIENKAQAWKC